MYLLAPPFAHLTALNIDAATLRHSFTANDPLPALDLPNPHLEPQVDENTRQHARAASVLMLFVGETSLRLLLTRRSPGLSFAGQQVFPGGMAERADGSALVTMQREVREELALQSGDYEVLGCLGDYYTHTGYRITAYVGHVSTASPMTPSPAEIDQVSLVPTQALFDAKQYQLRARGSHPYRANYFLQYGDVHITGPTISLLLLLYRALHQFRYGCD